MTRRKTEISKKAIIDGRVFYVRFAHGQVSRVDERQIYKGPYGDEHTYNATKWHVSHNTMPKHKRSRIYRVFQAVGVLP